MLRTISQEASYLVNKMPVDLSSYLLASSPPSSFDFLATAFPSRSDACCWGLNKDSFSLENGKTVCLSPDASREQCDPLKPIIVRSNSVNSEPEEEELEEASLSNSSSRSQSPHRPGSPGRGKKKVSFADHRGLALATVKIMSEPSHMPPLLSPNVLSALTKGATAGVTDQPPLVLKFQQPASDYLAFRDRIEHNCLSLENVIIRDYKVLGTMKVKNISFEKKVFARCTFDSWETFTDTNATYVDTPSAKNGSAFDTFAFEFEVPATFDKKKAIMFAVCFEAGHHCTQYWDSNNGYNYQIVSADFKALPDDVPLPTASNKSGSKDILRNVDSWTQFACWNKVDTSTPYW